MSNDTAFYEAGNILSKYYAGARLPKEEELISDLVAMVDLYESLVLGQTNSDSSTNDDGDEPPNLDYEDATRFRMHKRIERNYSLAKKAKSIHGYSCHVCNINFEAKYGSVGKNYIEAHHLRPLASLKGSKVALDPKGDFAVLCSNCHRMVHRSGLVDDIQSFKKQHFVE